MMNISLVKTRIPKLSIQATDGDDDELINISYRCSLDTENKEAFIVQFDLSVAQEKIKYDCIFQALFIATEPLTAAFVESNMAKMNLPAIAFPFLRAAISTISVQCGNKLLELPAINFVEMSKSYKVHKNE